MSSWNGRRTSAVLVWLFLLVATPVHAQGATETTAVFKPEEIEALVAPIALYPDPVLSQVLMASTYPLEIVHAARWVKANPKVKGDAAIKAVESQPWDPSVKSLVAFPQILEPMNDRLDWTQKLGDAFLAQQKDVFAAVQRLRARAQQSGNLQSNEQQKVTVEPPPTGSQATVVRIESANPEVIYVPAYNPTVVYGAWSSPAYPPAYWPPSPAYYPGAALMSGLAWGVGLAAAGAIFSDCDWNGGDVDIDYNKVTNIDRNFDRSKAQGQGGRWQHDASHRQGVAYRDNATRQKFAGDVPGADARSEYRGRGSDTGTRPGAADRAGAGSRPTGADRSGTGSRASAADRSSTGGRASAAEGGATGRQPSAADRGGTGRPPSAADRSGTARQPSAADRSTAGNRASSADRSVAANRDGASTRGATGNLDRGNSGNRAGYGDGGRDSAFSGVGAGGGASQRSYDRGRSSMQGSSFNRPSGGGGGGRGGGGGGRR